MDTPGEREQREDTGRGWAREIGPFLTLGIQLALSVVVFFFLGRWLDVLWGTGPWLMLGGLLIGVAGGFLQFFRAAAVLGKQADRDQRKASEESKNP